MNHFVDCILNDRESHCNLADAIHTHSIAFAALECYETKRPVTLPLPGTGMRGREFRSQKPEARIQKERRGTTRKKSDYRKEHKGRREEEALLCNLRGFYNGRDAGD